MPDVSARRKYVSLRGRVLVVPERMTKKIITKDPARKMRDTRPNDGSAHAVVRSAFGAERKDHS